MPVGPGVPSAGASYEMRKLNVEIYRRWIWYVPGVMPDAVNQLTHFSLLQYKNEELPPRFLSLSIARAYHFYSAGGRCYTRPDR